MKTSPADTEVVDLTGSSPTPARPGYGLETRSGRPLLRLSAGLASAWAVLLCLGQPGSLDENWGTSLNLDNAVYGAAHQADGKTLIGGAFNTVAGVSRSRIARLNSDGTLDTDFNVGTGANGDVIAIVVQPDGAILIAGRFTEFNGASRNRLARLNPDGSLDITFDPGRGPNNEAWRLALTPTGMILVCGLFTEYDGVNVGRVARLFSDGRLDLSFAGAANDAVHALALQADQKIVIGGNFTRVNGADRIRVARLDADGNLDPKFDPAAGPEGLVMSVAVQADGKVLIGGQFGTVNGARWSGTGVGLRYLCRLTSAGLPDYSFQASVDGGQVSSIALQPDGKVVIGGWYTVVNGQSRSRLARLLADGSLDPSFDPGAGASDWTYTSLQPDGNVTVWGGFTSFNGRERRFVARVQGPSTAIGGELEFGAASFEVSEGAGTATLEVRRVGNSSLAVEVEYAATPGTASLDDFTPVSGRLAFAAGEVIQRFSVPVRNDLVPEDADTVNLALSNPVGGAALGSQRFAVLRLKDDDSFSNAGGLEVAYAPRLNGYVSAFALQPDGRLVVVGDTREFNGVGQARIARLQPDGTTDSGFNPATWVDRAPNCVALQPDGKILIGGPFTVVNGVTRYRVARLNPDGTLDASFDPGTGPSDTVYRLVVLGDGAVVLVGAFIQYAGTPAARIVRLFSDGGLDPSFTAGANNTVNALVLQPDGRLVIGGSFTSVNGSLRNRVARLHASGDLDESFDPAVGFDGAIECLALQSDGRLLAGGWFGTVNGSPFRYLCRLTPDGLPDLSFSATPDNGVRSLAVQPETGRVLIGGDFGTVSGQLRSRVARLLADGAVDPNFEIGAGVEYTGFPQNVLCLAGQSDGRVLVGGTFDRFNGLTRSSLLRLLGSTAASGGEIEFAASAFHFSEAAGNATIEVRRSGASTGPVEVDYTTSPGTTQPGDFTSTAGTLRFAAGETVKTFPVVLRNDTTVEDDETVILTLRNPTGGAVLGSLRTATLVILDDDPFQNPGGVDVAFRGGCSGPIISLGLQSDGRVILAGEFTGVNQSGRLRLARLNPDGSLETTFNPGTWVNSAPLIAVQADGKIVLAGGFTQVNGMTRNYLARLHPDGTFDDTFDTGGGPNSGVWAVITLSSGDIFIGGTFTQFNGKPAQYLARVYSDGGLDTSFPVQANGYVRTLYAEADGRILVGGEFTQINGILRNRIARLTSDGLVDPTFDPGAGPNASVYAAVPQADGRVIIGGAFGAIHGVGIPYIGRLNADGTPDATFAPSPNGMVRSVAVDPDGKILLGGDFTHIGGVSRNRLARLLSDGTLDPAFDVGTGAGYTSGGGQVTVVLARPDGTLLVGGAFNQFNGLTRNNLVALQQTGSAAGGELEFAAPVFSVSENAGTATVTVRRTGAATAAVQVDYATSPDTATSGDFTPASAKLSFASGDRTKTFTVPIRNDLAPEDDERFLVSLRNPTGGAALGSPRTAAVEIRNDDTFDTAGALDMDFAPNVNGPLYAFALQPDGKMLVGGEFSVLNGVGRLRLARLDGDGAVDDTFYAATWLNGTVYALALQADGKVLVGGSFSSVNGVTRNNLARLNADGTLDDLFDPGPGPNSTVLAIAPLPIGDLLVAGSFTAFSGRAAPYVARVYSDGSPDPTFPIAANSYVRCLDVRPDGSFLIGGDFSIINGLPRGRVAQFTADATLDDAFNPGAGPDGVVYALARQADGKLLIGGTFGYVGGMRLPYLCRLFADGTADQGFSPLPDGTIFSISVQPDAKIVIAGGFGAVGGQSAPRVARLKPDGTLDPTFEVGTGPAYSGGGPIVYTTALQPDGNVIVGGVFNQFNGITRNFLARLQGLNAPSGGEFEFVLSESRVRENAGTATIEVRRNGNTSATAQVGYLTSHGTAGPGDYTTTSGTLVFNPGESRKSFSVPLRDETLVEDDETVNLTLRNPTGGAVLGSQRTATLVLLNDDSFNMAGGLEVGYPATLNSGGAVYALAPQTDGRLLVAGDFFGVNGAGRTRIARLNPDGSLDATFDPSLWLNGAVAAVTVQPDGRILLGGYFTVVSGVTRNYLARLNADGTLDYTFEPAAGPNNVVLAVTWLPSGHILIGGLFSQLSGQSAPYLARLYPDGILDTTFSVAPSHYVRVLAPQNDGRILMGGDFSSVNGTYQGGIARLNSDGTLDESFSAGAGAEGGGVYAVTTDAEGRILLGGSFTLINGAAQARVCRLLPSGVADLTFTPVVDAWVGALAAQADGRVVLGGSFGAVNGQARSRIARVLPDGALDPSFDVGTGVTSNSGSYYLNTLLFEADGSLLIGGLFTHYNGLTHNGIARLLGVASPLGGEIEFAASSFRVLEDRETATIEVRRAGNTGATVQVDYATAHATAGPADYAAASGKLTFAPGETRQTFTVTLYTDAQPEDDETVTLSLRNPTGGATLGGRREASLVLANDDAYKLLGRPDTSFSPRFSGGPVDRLLVQPDGKILVVGAFTGVNGQGRLRAVRLNADGNLDPGFTGALWLNGAVYEVAVDPDGRILLGGTFRVVSGLPRSFFVRVLPDGTIDPEFGTAAGPNADVYAIGFLDRGSLLVGGAFGQYGGHSVAYLAEVFSDGTVNPAFPAALNGPVYCLADRADGRWVVAGAFTSVNGVARSRVAQLYADGSLDDTFDSSAGPDSSVYAVAVQPDGRVLIGGAFGNVAGQYSPYLCRLGADGHLDPSFVATLNNVVDDLVLQADGNLLVSGRFTSVNGQPRNRIVRLRADGSLDGTFDIGAGANDQVSTVALQHDGDILIGGSFSQFDNLTRAHLARLLGSIRQDVKPLEFLRIADNHDGQLRLTLAGPRGQRYTLEATTDFRAWQPLNTSIAPAASFEVFVPKPPGIRATFYRTISLP